MRLLSGGPPGPSGSWETQDFSDQLIHEHRIAHLIVVAHRDVELAVGAEPHGAAVVLLGIVRKVGDHVVA